MGQTVSQTMPITHASQKRAGTPKTREVRTHDRNTPAQLAYGQLGAVPRVLSTQSGRSEKEETLKS